MSLTNIAASGLPCTKNRKTLYNHCKKNNIATPRKRFTSINEDTLEEKIQILNKEHPNAGAEEIQSRLHTAEDINARRSQVRELLRKVDPIGTAARWAQLTQRRKYFVRSPNSLWHIDNNHALRRSNAPRSKNNMLFM